MKLKVIIGSEENRDFDIEYAGLTPHNQCLKFLDFIEEIYSSKKELVEIYTNNEYIIHLLNLLMICDKVPTNMRKFTRGLSIKSDELEVYKWYPDRLKDIKYKEDYINTVYLSCIVDRIYKECWDNWDYIEENNI